MGYDTGKYIKSLPIKFLKNVKLTISIVKPFGSVRI